MNSLAVSNPKFSITEQGIQFHQDLEFDEWEELGGQLRKANNSIGFMIGDWINYGDGKFGEKYDEALARTNIDYGTLRNYAHVARRVHLSLRNDKLTWNHHATVAKLKTNEEQQHWLDVARENRLSVRRLRKSINFGRIATEEETQGDPADRGYVTYLALLNRLRRWWKREIGKAPVNEWDDHRREVLKKDFKLVLEIYEEL